MVTTFYPPYSFGGDANFVRNLSHQLAARGHSVDILHCRDSYRLMGGLEPANIPAEPANITVHALDSRWGPLSPFATHQFGYPLFKTRQIESVLSKSFDVIHYHNVSLIGGPAVLQYGAATKLYTWHEYWLVCPTHLLMRDGQEPCAERHCTSCALKQNRPPQFWRSTGLLQRSLASIDVFFSPSRFGIAKHSELRLQAPVIHLPPFVPRADSPPPAAQTEPYFLYAGRLEHAKGPQTLIEPFRHWNRAKLILAGAGAQQKNLRRAAAGSDRIELTGHLSGDALRALYRNAVALIVPSLTYELSPLVILEAFQEGTPVIVRDHGSLPELVLDSGGGLLYSNNDELIAQACRLLSDTRLRQELGARGREAVLTRWSAKAHMNRYLQVIDEAIERKRAQSNAGVQFA